MRPPRAQDVRKEASKDGVEQHDLNLCSPLHRQGPLLLRPLTSLLSRGGGAATPASLAGAQGALVPSGEPEPGTSRSVYRSCCRLTPQTAAMDCWVNPASGWNLIPDSVFPWMLISNELEQKYHLPPWKWSKQLAVGTLGRAE